MNKLFIITFVAVSFLFSVNLFAQENSENRKDRHFDREAFEAKRNAFITAEVGLTPEEAAVFIPLCDQLRQKKFEAGKNYRRFSREISKKQNPTPEEYTKAIDMYLEVGMIEAGLEKEYFEKFKEVLSPEKLYKYRDAEMKFARHFMRENRDGHRGQQQKNNKK